MFEYLNIYVKENRRKFKLEMKFYSMLFGFYSDMNFDYFFYCRVVLRGDNYGHLPPEYKKRRP